MICTLLPVGVSAVFGLRHFSAVARASETLNVNLIEAIKQGDGATVRRLLDGGADPNTREVVLTKPSLAERAQGGQPTLADTALVIAAQKGSLQVVRLLLQRGAAANGRGVVGFTPLIEAIRYRHPELAEVLLKSGARPNQRNGYGDTALLFAANQGQPELISLLLDHGADGNDGGSGRTPLAEATERGWEDVVRLLISRGANVNQRRAGFPTALECALLTGHEEIANLIRNAGGRGRSLAELQRLRDRKVERWRAKRPTRPRLQGRDQVLTDEDRQVIATVLLDLLSNAGDLAFRRTEQRPDVVLIDSTAPGPGSDDQLNSELDVEKANDVSLEIRKHLAQRNGEPISLADFRLTSKHILLHGEDTVPARFDFFEKMPQARGWVRVRLPGYSKSHERAVLRFYLGPSAHGAAGTYCLEKQDGEWRVKWSDLAFYL